MIVVTLTDCPPRLRGDLSKWLLEINTGVYVGQIERPRPRKTVGKDLRKSSQRAGDYGILCQ